MAIQIISDSATVSTTEYSLPADSTTLAAQTDDCVLQTFVKVAGIAAGDEFRVRVYEKVNAQTADVFYEAWLNLGKPHVAVPSLIVGEGWDVTVLRTAGTDRVVHWSLRKLT